MDLSVRRSSVASWARSHRSVFRGNRTTALSLTSTSTRCSPRRRRRQVLCLFFFCCFCFVLFCLSLCCLFRPRTHPLGVNNIAAESESFFFKSGTAGVAVRSTVRGATTATAIAAAPSRKNATTTTRLTTAVADNFKVQLSKSFPVARFSGTTGDGRASYAGQLGWWGVLLQGFFFCCLIIYLLILLVFF
jgi:hypothetical protein